MSLTRARARACIERGLVQAQTLGFKVAIAVVDDAGHLVVCDRMDGALWVTPEIARAKANAARAAFYVRRPRPPRAVRQAAALRR